MIHTATGHKLPVSNQLLAVLGRPRAWCGRCKGWYFIDGDWIHRFLPYMEAKLEWKITSPLDPTTREQAKALMKSYRKRFKPWRKT